MGVFFFNDDNDLRLNYERRRAANVGSPLLTLDFGFNAWFPFSNRDKFNGRFETRNVNKYLAKIAGSFYWQNQYRSFTNQTVILPFVNTSVPVPAWTSTPVPAIAWALVKVPLSR